MAEARAVYFKLGGIEVSAYQLVEDGLQHLLFTHRQIGEPVGKTKALAQKFCKDHEQELPPTVTAIVPDKPKPVALSSWSAALAYSRHQAQAGNATALALVKAARDIPESELPIEVQLLWHHLTPRTRKILKPRSPRSPRGMVCPTREDCNASMRD